MSYFQVINVGGAILPINEAILYPLNDLKRRQYASMF